MGLSKAYTPGQLYYPRLQPFKMRVDYYERADARAPCAPSEHLPRYRG